MTNMTIANQNAAHLANSARECIRLLNEKSQKIEAVVSHWNLCVNQAHFSGVMDVPSETYRRRAHFIADLERMIPQLEQFQAVENERAATAAAVAAGEIPAPAREEIVFESHAAIKQIVDIDGEPMMEAVVNSDCSAADMDAIHAEAMEMNEKGKLFANAFELALAAEHAPFRAFWKDIEILDFIKASHVWDAMHDEALEENCRFGWLANRFNLFWGGCDSSTRRSMMERAHDEAIRINREKYSSYAPPAINFLCEHRCI